MGQSIPPKSDAELRPWAQNVAVLTTAEPLVWGTTAAWATAFMAKNGQYVAALATAENPTTAGPLATKTKNDVKAELIAMAKQLVGVVRTQQPPLTDAQLYEIGIPPRKKPAPQPRPVVSPVGTVANVNGRIVTMRFHTPTDTRRALVDGAAGMSIFTYVGPTPPENIDDWAFYTNTGKLVTEVVFPASVASFSTVFLTAFYFNGRKESGPACQPIEANLGKGSVAAVA